MSIPVNALKDDELLHYATIDPGAAAELARRIADGSIDPAGERESLLEEIRELEYSASESDEASEMLDRLMDDVGLACKLIRRAMSEEEKELSVNELLQKALDHLES